MLVTWDTGSAYTNQPSLSWQTWRTPEKLYKWYGDRVEKGESCKPTEPATGEMIFPGPPFPQKSPQMGEGRFFPPLPQKMPILFHSGNKRQFKLCLQSVSNHQNQLVEAEKLFKKVTFLPDSTVYRLLGILSIRNNRSSIAEDNKLTSAEQIVFLVTVRTRRRCVTASCRASDATDCVVWPHDGRWPVMGWLLCNLPDLLFWYFVFLRLVVSSFTAFILTVAAPGQLPADRLPAIPARISTHKRLRPCPVACCLFASGRLIRQVMSAAESYEISGSVVSRHKRSAAWIRWKWSWSICSQLPFCISISSLRLSSH